MTNNNKLETGEKAAKYNTQVNIELVRKVHLAKVEQATNTFHLFFSLVFKQ